MPIIRVMYFVLNEGYNIAKSRDYNVIANFMRKQYELLSC